MIAEQRQIREAKEVHQIEDDADHNDDPDEQENRGVHWDALNKVEDDTNKHEAENESNHTGILLGFRRHGWKMLDFNMPMQKLIDLITKIDCARNQNREHSRHDQQQIGPVRERARAQSILV